MSRLSARSPRARTAQRSRPGITLAELVVALAVLGIVGGTVLRVITGQQRFYRGASEIIEARGQLRQAASILPSDLRGLSSAGGDLKAVTDSSVEFLANIGSGVICNVGSPLELDIPPRDLVRHTLTTWSTQPQPGDSVFVFDEGASAGPSDDAWRRHAILAVAANSTTCPGAPFADPVINAPALKPRWRITLAPGTALTRTIATGAAIRFVRPVRHSLYRAPDRLWYIGFKEHVGGSWSTVQPVSGPYRAYSSGGSGGLNIQYWDTTGAPATSNNAVARIDLHLRSTGQSARNAVLSGGGQFNDSLVVRVAVRNRL